MTSVADAPARADEGAVHILWMNGGLSCDGDSVALTAATQPSICLLYTSDAADEL